MPPEGSQRPERRRVRRPEPLLTARLRDGTTVALRFIGPADRAQLLAGFEWLSPETRYWRFFTPMPRLSETMLDYLVSTDGRDHVAIGAFPSRRKRGMPRAIVGVARFVRLKETRDTAEAAVAVVDVLQRRGLGALLLTTLTQAARERGIRKFRFNVLAANRSLYALLLRLGLTPVPCREPDSGYDTFDVLLPQHTHRRLTIGRILRVLARWPFSRSVS